MVFQEPDLSSRTLVQRLQSEFTVLGTVDLTRDPDIDWMTLYLYFKQFYKTSYQNNERIIVVMDKDWYDDRFPCGILLEGIQRIVNLVDISNFFIIVVTPNVAAQTELDYLVQSISTDPVPIDIYVSQGQFNRHPQGNKSRFNITKIDFGKDSGLPTRSPRHNDLLTNNTAFCMAPWTHLFVTPNKQVRPCCVSQTTVGDVAVSSLEQIWNSESIKEIRSQMLRGQKHPACSVCYIDENANKHSYRHYINQKMSQHVAKTDATSTDGRLENFELNYLHFQFSNLCNLACRMCRPNVSSSWHAVATELGYIPKNSQALVSANEDGKLFDQFTKHLDHIDLIKFTGGEPLIMQEFYDILDLLIESQRTDVELFYNTNLMQVKYKGRNILDLWKNFPKVVIGASIDAEGKKGEYIRSLSKWPTILQNMQAIKTQCPHAYLFVSATVSILNVLHLPDLHKSLVDQNLINVGDFDISTLVGPSFLSILSAPDELNQAVIKRYQKHLSWLQQVDKSGRSITAFSGVLKLMNQRTEFNKNLFWKQIKDLDRYHKTDLLEIFPELQILPR